MEPNILVGREEPCQLWSDDANDVAEHWDEDQATIESEDETGPTGGPDGPLEGVESGKSLAHELTVPPIPEKEEVEAVEDDVEGESPWNEELPMEPVFTHV
jgi:hypothetical protein